MSTKRELILSHHINKNKKKGYASDSIHWQIEEVSEQGSTSYQLNMVVNALLRHACIIIIIIIIIAACKKN